MTSKEKTAFRAAMFIHEQLRLQHQAAGVH